VSVYAPGASTGDEAFVTLHDAVHRLGAGDSIRFDCSVPHRIANPGRRQLRCIWAITPPTF